jgi:transposase
MEVKPALVLPEGVELVGCERSDDVLLITMTSTQCSPCCPLCGMKAGRVHSRYTRKLTDPPCGGQPVRLLLQVRKYFCENPDCQRKIFVERLTPFVAPWAHVTQRLCANCAGRWSANWRQAGRACHRSVGNTNFAPHHSPASYGSANRAGWADYRVGY